MKDRIRYVGTSGVIRLRVVSVGRQTSAGGNWRATVERRDGETWSRVYGCPHQTARYSAHGSIATAMRCEHAARFITSQEQTA